MCGLLSFDHVQSHQEEVDDAQHSAVESEGRNRRLKFFMSSSVSWVLRHQLMDRGLEFVRISHLN